MASAKYWGSVEMLHLLAANDEVGPIAHGERLLGLLLHIGSGRSSAS